MLRFSARLGVLALLVFASACDSGAEDDIQDDDVIRVAFNVGQQRTYTTRYVSDGLLDAQPPYDTRGRVVERVTAIGQTVGDLNGITLVNGLTLVESAVTYDDSPVGYTLRINTWYRQSDERLEEVASQTLDREPTCSGDCPPPSLFISPSIVIEYPAEPGRSWRRTYGIGTRSEITEMETVTTRAGTFRCAVVRTRTSGYERVEWIADAGIVRRSDTSRRPFLLPDGTVGESVDTYSVELIAITGR